ncbi:MAG: hypothetical protein LBC68_09830 [Prevotellaceae bacterium]|nr:hypothetical protein [Prevotellaceae bacterium]
MKKLALIIAILAFAVSAFTARAGIACGGCIQKTNNTYEIQYYITDHLGSTRVVVSSGGTVAGSNDYYPFGKLWESANTQAPTTRYLFSGKELQTSGGINYMDFGSRMYDDFLGRWFTHDPQSYKRPWESPYGYCGGNPVVRIDPDGRVWWLVPVIIGAAVGAYSGGVIANNGQMNPFKWNYNSQTFGYMLGGAIVGGISGYAGAYIATSGIPFANTSRYCNVIIYIFGRHKFLHRRENACINEFGNNIF